MPFLEGPETKTSSAEWKLDYTFSVFVIENIWELLHIMSQDKNSIAFHMFYNFIMLFIHTFK